LEDESKSTILKNFIANLNHACREVDSILFLSFIPIFLVTSIFWSFFVFDTLGAEKGLFGSFWVLIVMPALPVIISGAINKSYQHREIAHNKSSNEDKKEFELSPVSISSKPSNDIKGLVEMD
jgi:hypothetical protein